MGIGLPEVILILIVILIFIGPKKLPDAGKALGKAMREFRFAINGKEPSPESCEKDENKADTSTTGKASTGQESA